MIFIMKLTIHTDGGSLNNPGEAGIGFLIHDEKKLIYKHAEAIGIASNNVAEYTALIRALSYVRDQISLDVLDPEEIEVIADSELMIKQITGIYKVKNKDLKTLHSKIKMLEMEISIPILFKHVLRKYNAEADFLVKQALSKA